MSPDQLVESYLAERAHLIATAAPGPAAARELSDLTDRAVSAVAETALACLGRPWALLALGGWGTRQLLPGSDLDLLVITDAPPGELRPAVSEVLYPLWDAGLKVGHQVRSRREHVRRCRDDIEALTATLRGRVLAGDATLGTAVLADVGTDASKRSKRVLEAIRARPRPGSPYLLEPDLKEGAGGQRDIDEIAWTAAVSGRPRLAGFCDAARLSAAADAICTARWVLHAESGRASNVLTLDSADDPALDAPGVQRGLADVHHTLLRVRAALAGTAPPENTSLGADGLFALLDCREAALDNLEDAAWSGRLDDLVPSFTDLMVLRRPGLTHLYTVGAHSLRCAVTVAGDVPAGPSRTTLQVAALLHDTGKAQLGPGHAERGADAVMTLGGRFGLAPEETADAALLVREHLLLAETAATQDLHDEDVLLRVASRVPRVDLVSSLRSLTAADGAAAGPGVWTSWHAALVGELADRVGAELASDADGAELARRAERARADAIAMLGESARPEAVSFVRDAGVRYLSSQPSDNVVAHADLVADVMAGGDPSAAHTAVSPGPANGTWRVTVAAPDRPGLFAALAGTLAMCGLDVLSADAFSAPSGIALDVFVVRSDTLAEVDTYTWSAFDRSLRSVLQSLMDLDARLEQRRSHYSRDPDVATTVSIEDPGAYATAIDVRAANRVGLLYDVANAISEAGLDIRWVKATTRGRVVRDVFHVVDASGEPVDDPGVLGHLAMRIRERA